MRFECGCECQGKVALPTQTPPADRVGIDSARFECACECQGKVALPTQIPRGDRIGNAGELGLARRNYLLMLGSVSPETNHHSSSLTNSMLPVPEKANTSLLKMALKLPSNVAVARSPSR